MKTNTLPTMKKTLLSSLWMFWKIKQSERITFFGYDTEPSKLYNSSKSCLKIYLVLIGYVCLVSLSITKFILKPFRDFWQERLWKSRIRKIPGGWEGCFWLWGRGRMDCMKVPGAMVLCSTRSKLFSGSIYVDRKNAIEVMPKIINKS